MPALVKSRVGSLAGTSEEECTRLCSLLSKKRRNCSRISEPVGILSLFNHTAVGETLTHKVHEGHEGLRTGLPWPILTARDEMKRGIHRPQSDICQRVCVCVPPSPFCEKGFLLCL